jgi:AGZA family xanthine/uracil permease-like MFS transporter
MVLMPFTYSITVGIGAGVILYVILQAVVGKVKKVHPLIWVIAALFILYFMRGPIQAFLS